MILCLNPLFAQWGSDTRLTYNDSVSYLNWNSAWCIAASGDTVLAVWSDGRDGNNEIYFKRSLDGGVNWTADTRLTNDTALSQTPAIAFANNFVHILWTDMRQGNYEIYYKHSENGGSTWLPDYRLTYSYGLSAYPSMVAPGNDVYAVWVDQDLGTGMDEVRFKHSSCNGYGWDPDVRITEYDVIWNPSIAVSGNYIHIVWQDWRDLGYGKEQIRYRRSTDNGITWEPEIRLSQGTEDSWYASIAASGNNVHVVWMDARDGNHEIYYKRSTDNGLNWGPDTRLTFTSSSSDNPNITVSGWNVHIVWVEESAGDLYYKYSSDNGATWGPDTRLTNNPGSSFSPSIAVSGTKVHVLWTDERDGNPEIYYKRNPTGNFVEEVSNPKPANKYFSAPIFFKNSIFLKFVQPPQSPIRIALYNLSGALVFEKTITQTHSYLTIVDERIEALSPSIYFLSLSANGKNIGFVKVIKPQ